MKSMTVQERYAKFTSKCERYHQRQLKKIRTMKWTPVRFPEPPSSRKETYLPKSVPPTYVATAYMGIIHYKQCIGRLCRVVNGRLVTITYLFL